ncbi:hypothetical protein [Clostridium tyrobutyricum]|uniref:hypothetical protein n=1 Tax=Clostridium tyrobutyricum TaxID=1519 RepID=UPI001C39192F|nr:hypothetical protein [Clostridium tyrobutyricum]MBV4423166.1 hypothetical protein [Clostridium tyrobutyricum]
MVSNQIANIIASGVLSVLGALASYGVTVGVNYLKKKRDALIAQMGINKYNENYKLAHDLYYTVEQKFRFVPDAGKQKADEFNKLLVEKIPGISQEEMDHFRETICGKINSEVKSSEILAPAFDATKETADVANVAENTSVTQK